MTTGDILKAVAETMPVWRDTVVAVLALVVIGCIWFYVEVIE
jgi:hypothetical protein